MIRNKNRSRRKGLLIVLAAVLFLCAVPKNLAVADGQTVRVGCVDIENFLEVDEAGNAWGYGAEYLDKIQRYTGWNYKYVTGSWSQCLEWLKDGEIDLLLPAGYSEERAREFLFSDMECCLDYTALLGRKSDENRYFEDFEAFDGMTVGMIKGNNLNEYFERYAMDNKFTYEARYFETGIEMEDALERKEADAIVNGNLEYKSNQKLLARINNMPTYFITTGKNDALMKELNKALQQIFLQNPYYTANLHDKYYDSVDRQSIGFTREESEYIENSGEIQIVVNKENDPLEWMDEQTGRYGGICVDIAGLLERESGLTFRFVADDGEGGNQKKPGNREEPGSREKENKAGKGDRVYLCAYPADINGRQEALTYTSAYYNCNYSLISRKGKNLNLSEHLTIAMIKEQGTMAVVERERPNWDIVTYEDMDACLRAMGRGEADLAAINPMKLSLDEELLRRDATVVDGNALNVPISLGIPATADPMLVSVLDKAILKIDSSELEGIVFNSVLSVKDNVTLKSLMEKHPLTAIAVGMFILLLIFVGAVVIYRNISNRKQRQILQEKNRELEEAVTVQEQLRVEAQTDALTGLKNKSSGEMACRSYLDCFPEENHGFLILDVDNFKNVNDTYGHQYGDSVLKKFGEILRGGIRKQDIVARIGGDEFLVFMASVESKEPIIRWIDEMHEKVENLMEIPIYCSVGIVISKGSESRFDELFFEADQALYEAKSKGKNQYVFAENEHAD